MKHLFFSLWVGAVGCALVLQCPSTAIAQRQEAVLHAFGGSPDGAAPGAALIDVKGTLYGTTRAGGTYEQGAVFAIDPDTGVETVVYSFCSKVKKGTCESGSEPVASLISVKERLYSTTLYGGTGHRGTVFVLDPKTGKEKVLYSFCSQQNCTDGEEPTAGLIDVNGTLYGTTAKGGAYKRGTVFALDPDTGAELVLHSFGRHKDGFDPVASLIEVNDTLYGTTSFGGVQGQGTVFAIDPATGAETVLYSFCSQQNCTDGNGPGASLVEMNGTLYGTTGGGGTSNNGAVFALELNGGAEMVLHSFCSRHRKKICEDGANPYANLIDVRGMLYGTTGSGGENCLRRRHGRRFGGCGTVFSLNPNTGREKVLYSFCSQLYCTDGEVPGAGLIDVNGTLYSTTYEGGADKNCYYGCGTVFALTH
ncbi:MAG TPA: choice-of-anchor tandem repeat GloVer-containing protein [Rhizomicrobium sp.]|nr:choice-of-anchor tandem repeat GloVer-containing protein [Rhizomicrobium sp.]